MFTTIQINTISLGFYFDFTPGSYQTNDHPGDGSEVNITGVELVDECNVPQDVTVEFNLIMKFIEGDYTKILNTVHALPDNKYKGRDANARLRYSAVATEIAMFIAYASDEIEDSGILSAMTLAMVGAGMDIDYIIIRLSEYGNEQ